MTRNVTDIVRGVAVTAAVALLVVLIWHLGQPGYTHTRLVFFAVLGAFAVVGAIGVRRHSTRLVTLGAGGLLVLGLWQAVLWLYIYPVVGLLVVATLLDSYGTNSNATPA